MPKLKLDLDVLRVQSFATDASDGRRGTVRGASVDTFQPWCSFDGPCTGTCTVPTYPQAICLSVPGEVCPQVPPQGPPTA